MPTIDEILKLDACRNLYKEDVDQLRAAIESAIREARAEERERCKATCAGVDIPEGVDPHGDWANGYAAGITACEWAIDYLKD